MFAATVAESYRCLSSRPPVRPLRDRPLAARLCDRPRGLSPVFDESTQQTGHNADSMATDACDAHRRCLSAYPKRASTSNLYTLRRSSQRRVRAAI